MSICDIFHFSWGTLTMCFGIQAYCIDMSCPDCGGWCQSPCFVLVHLVQCLAIHFGSSYWYIIYKYNFTFQGLLQRCVIMWLKE